MWPAAIVAAALMLFGALGSAVNADELGDVQSSSGDDVVQADEEVAVYVVVEGDAPEADEDADDKAAVKDAVDALVAAETTGAVAAAEIDLDDAIEDVFGTDELGNEVNGPDGTSGDVEGDDADDGTVDFNGDGDFADVAPLFGDAPDDGERDDGVGVDNGLIATLKAAILARNGETLDANTVAAARAAITVAGFIKGLDALEGPEGGDVNDEAKYTVEVDGSAEIIEVLTGPDKLTTQVSARTRVGGVSPVLISADDDVLEDFDLTAKTEVLLVVVECTSGSFEVSFESDAAGGLSESAEFQCQGLVDGAEISASKSTVYSAGSAESDITVTIEDEDGSAATAGDEVTFTTNSCVFDNGKAAMDADSESDGDETVAEVTLDCSDASAGDAEVVARIDKPGRDIILSTTVNVVGPPASLTVDAVSMMDVLTCGEVATLAINVVDSAGQPVVNGTVVNLTTNVAGVLVLPVTTSGGDATRT